jgi:SAM-dependent methyltransferase
VGDDLEYSGLMAQGWDPLRGDTSDWEDRAFFLSLIRSVGEPVLDVGCGTGRLLVDYLSQGVDIDGVEISPDMVSILRDKASAAGLDVHDRVHLAAMETMELARRYQLVIVPSGSYHLLVDPTHATSAMQRFFEHLKPGGTLAVTWLDIAGDHPDGADECFVKEAQLVDGSTIRRTYRAWFDASTGLEHTDDLYERLRDGVVIDRQRRLRSPATRHYPRSAIAGIHAGAGFEAVRLLSLSTAGQVDHDDRFVVSVARRPT